MPPARTKPQLPSPQRPVLFRVRGFAGLNNPRCAPGTLLVETTHVSTAGAVTEILAWKGRMRCGDVAYGELIDLRGSRRIVRRFSYETEIDRLFTTAGA